MGKENLEEDDENVVPLHKPPSDPKAHEIVRTLIRSGAYDWDSHSLKRMRQRQITTIQVLNCLQKGKITESAHWSFKHGGCHQLTMGGYAAGEWLDVVVRLLFTQNMLIITPLPERNNGIKRRKGGKS